MIWVNEFSVSFLIAFFRTFCNKPGSIIFVTTRATSVVEGRKEGIIGRSITAQVGRGRCDQGFVLQYSQGVSGPCLLNSGSLLLPFL